MKMKDDRDFISHLNNLSDEEGKSHITQKDLDEAPIIGRDFGNNLGLSRTTILPAIPEGRKYKVARRIAELLKDKEPTSYFSLARCIKPRLPQSDYQAKHKTWNKKIQNRLRTLKKCWRKSGCKIKRINTPVEGYQVFDN